MIDPSRLQADLQRLLKRLEDDIQRRMHENESIDAHLQEQYEAAKAASRTAQAYAHAGARPGSLDFDILIVDEPANA